MNWLLKRWWFWAGTGFMLVAVCAGYLLIPVEKRRITQENCDKIQLGWSWEQVVDLLGIQEQARKHELSAHVSVMRWWEDEDGNGIRVVFESENGFNSSALTIKEFIPTTLSFGERIRRRVERRIRAFWP
jgi:hypothetical protein